MRKLLIVTGLILLTACGPVPVEMAEKQCLESARLAQRPRGNISIGADSNGNMGSSFSIGISSDYLMGRDPDQVYAVCVQRKSGQMPTRPFSSRPESRL